MNLIDHVVAYVIARENEIIEEALERALLTGEYGVKVVRRDGLIVSAEPHPEVPYGELHEHRIDR
jgi:hypothetical protein